MKTKKEIIGFITESIINLVEIPFLKSKKTTKSLILEMENNCSVVFSFDTVLAGVNGKDSFVLSFSMSIYNLFLSDILNCSFGKTDLNPNTKNLVFSINYHNPYFAKWNVYERYLFLNEKNNEVIANIVDDIKKYYIPNIVPFISDYNMLLDNYRQPFFVNTIGNWWQFITGIIAAFLTSREAEIETFLVPLARSNSEKIDFLDFKNATDYKKDLIDPVKQYLIKSNIII